MPEVRYTFTASGQEGVISAFQGITASAEANARAFEKSAGVAKKASAKTVQAAKQEAAGMVQATQQQVNYRTAQLRKMSAEERGIIRARRHLWDQEKRLNRDREREAARVASREARAQQRVARGRRQTFGQMATAGVYVAGAALAGGARVGGRALREGMALRDQATDIAVRSRTPGGPSFNSESLARGFERTATSTPGAKAEDVAGAVSAFITKTGKGAIALSMQKVFAEIAVATNSSAADIGSAAADIFKKFGITGVNDMREALAILAVQGKEGAFELKDAAKQFPRLAAAARVFGMEEGVQGVAKLGGLTQIARESTGTGPQAATAVEAMFRTLTGKSEKIKALTGANVFTDESKTQGRDINDVLVDVIGGAKGNVEIIGKVFEKRAQSAVMELVKTYNEQIRAGKGEADAREAVRKQLLDAQDVQEAVATMEEDLATQGTTFANQLTSAWETFKAAFSDEAIGGVKSFIESIGNMEKQFGLITGAGESLGELFGNVAGGLDTLMNILKSFGIQFGDKISPEKRLEMATRAYEERLPELEEQKEDLLMSIGQTTDEKKEKRLRSRLDKKDEEIQKIKDEYSEAGAKFKASGHATDRLAEGGFIGKLMATGVSESYAEDIASRVKADPNVGTPKGIFPAIADFLGGRPTEGSRPITGMNEEQAKLIQQFANEQTAKINGEDTQRELDALGNALAKATKEASAFSLSSNAAAAFLASVGIQPK